VQTHATRVAFISTPSVYFSLPKSSALSRSSMVFDVRTCVPVLAALRLACANTDSCVSPQLDTRWATHANFCAYNFQQPEDIPAELHHTARDESAKHSAWRRLR
jgi:hypothetical protein